MFLLIIRNDTTIKVIIFLLFWTVVCHVVHLCFFLGELGSATSNGPEMIAPMATPLFL